MYDTKTMATFRMFAFTVFILSGVLGVKVAKLIPSVFGHPVLCLDYDSVSYFSCVFLWFVGDPLD
jgi:hypothetical protein